MSKPATDRFLSAQDIFNADDTTTLEFVPCPEWGYVKAPEDGPDFHDEAKRQPIRDDNGYALDEKGKRIPKGVNVRALTTKEVELCRKQATETVSDPTAKGGVRQEISGGKLQCLIVTQAAVNANGEPLFKIHHYEKLMEKAGGPIGRIGNKAMKMAGMISDEDELGNSPTG